MTPRRLVRLVGGLALAILLTGCPRPPPIDRFTVGRPLAIDDERATSVLEDHRTRAGVGSALRGSARVALEGPDFKLNRPQRIAIARPGRLRFEILGLFDVMAALLVTDGREFGFYEASTGEITRGRVTRALLFELAGLDLEPTEVVELLLAAPLPSNTLARAGVWLEPDEGITVAYAPPGLDAERDCRRGEADPEAGASPSESPCVGSPEDLARGGEIFRFDAEGLLREMRSMSPGYVTRYRASFERYEELPDHQRSRRFPMRVTVDSPALESVARFDWKRVLLEEELPGGIFTIPDLPGTGG